MRFVVVEIPDNDEAHLFIDAIRRGNILYGNKVGTSTVEGVGEVDEIGWRPMEGEWKVPMMYAVPTQFCEHTDRAPEGRSKKYGWYVCTKCAKPRPGSMQHPYNLLQTDFRKGSQVYYLSFRADRRGWFLYEEPPEPKKA